MNRQSKMRADWRRVARGCAVAALLAWTPHAFADEPTPDWNPESSERLVKLPATYLKKSLDHDFAQSALGTALQGANDDIDAKARQLADIQGAVAKSSGPMRIEMRHQF